MQFGTVAGRQEPTGSTLISPVSCSVFAWSLLLPGDLEHCDDSLAEVYEREAVPLALLLSWRQQAPRRAKLARRQAAVTALMACSIVSYAILHDLGAAECGL